MPIGLEEYNLQLLKLAIEAKTNSMKGNLPHFNLVMVRSNGGYYGVYYFISIVFCLMSNIMSAAINPESGMQNISTNRPPSNLPSQYRVFSLTIFNFIVATL